MAPAVRQTFTRLYRETTGRTPEEADPWLAGLIQEGRYQQDVLGLVSPTRRVKGSG